MPIYSELELIEQQLKDLELQREKLLARKKILLNQPASGKLLSSREKVALFLNLFKGRMEAHALRWQNQSGRSGYSVACHNEWKQGICFKPKVKCSECKHQAFKTLDDNAIHSHLIGKQTVGLYPLLNDNTCWLLAADFDKSDWKEAVSSFRHSCQFYKIYCYIERSRSGNGAHIWIFFETPIPASKARELGFLLLDKAMEFHSGLSFESYDRLFPNQDTIPTGGFGNLIALPLQYHPRQQGNSVFIDESFNQVTEQWQHLLDVKKVSRLHVDQLINEKQPFQTEKLDKKPWELNFAKQSTLIAGCPKDVSVILANRIFIDTKQLPQALLTLLKRTASFSNPVFFKTQALRFSTNGIPRFICLAEKDDGYLSLPRGCIDDVISLFEDNKVVLELEDKRKTGCRLTKLEFQGELRKEQSKAVATLLKHDVGILHAPTAFGKTVTAIGIIHKRKVNTLILVHSRQLLTQWKERLQAFIAGTDIGVIGAGKNKPTQQIDVATYQSLVNRKDNSIDPIIYEYGQIIIDECHHVSAPQYERLLSEVHAKYVLGITATPNRQDGHQPIIFMQAGAIRYTASSEDKKFIKQVNLNKLNLSIPAELQDNGNRPHISKIYRWLATNEERNKAIVEDILIAAKSNRTSIVLTERREHAELLTKMLSEQIVEVKMLHGVMKEKEKQHILNHLDQIQVLVATGKYVGEGFDFPKLDTLFLVLPISWKGALTQYVGRIQRLYTGKEKVIVYDYVESGFPMLERMYKKREKGYEALGFTIYNSDNAEQKPLDLEFK
ncbi:DEAD/DEAH box helicase [Parashewanella spongiae]|uniref:TOTE conflict system archaeo-eukaryotic primase domain-containing protein n=1 Tax=Parashewanella spongiae TaxID=342950 RepID=UPI001FB412A3|nr:DEAD/DEAH box helicase [Parashewanella spongiae]MCL1079836.1 DEAD/DEAH box helicase [Parashewanella spongiae]